MHVVLAPGETLLPGTQEALREAFLDPGVGAVLLPLVPTGRTTFARAARRYVAAWDARFLHPMNYFVPAGRVALREPVSPGHCTAHAAPHLAALIDAGCRVEALPRSGVASPVGNDLGAWVAWARREGHAWGRLAARDASFRGFLPALSKAGWLRHNVIQSHRRVIEITQALRRAAPLEIGLHLAREAAWTRGCVEGFREGSRQRRGPG